MPLLEINGLKTYYYTDIGVIKAVDDVNLILSKGECLGIAGESGCGKTTLVLSVLRLIKPPGRIVGGEIIFGGTNLLSLKSEEMRKIRWRKIAMVFQGAMNALNPVHTVGSQIVEALMNHLDYSKSEAERKAVALLNSVGLNSAVFRSYPHELSGGMKQRALIAMALSCDPDILFADQPTTALDVVTQAQTLKLLKDLQKQRDLSIIIVSHDLSILAQICEKIAVMYAGKLIEYADAETIYGEPAHPYTAALINAFPSVKGPKKPLSILAGEPPDMINLPPGCPFNPRCSLAREICREVEPKLVHLGSGRHVACHLCGEN